MGQTDLPDGDEQAFFEQEFENLDLANREVVNKVFDSCTFKSCILSGTFLKDCKFYDCHFESCNMSNMKVTGSAFSNNMMEDSKAIGINWTEIKLPSIKVYNPFEFSGCNINHSIFLGMDLKEVSIHDCQARNVDFRDADLTKADLCLTDFLNSHFNKTNLTQANLSNAVNYTINVFDNIIKGARFSLPEAICLLDSLEIEIGPELSPD